MIATALRTFDWQKLLLTKSEMQRMLFAGTAWGAAMSAGIAGMTFWSCDIICMEHVAMTAAISVSAGILAIGPVAAYGRR
jgi:hypothetical protein